MSSPKVQQAPIQRAPAQVASRMEEVQEKPIELITADKDVKKKKKIALLMMRTYITIELKILQP